MISKGRNTDCSTAAMDERMRFISPLFLQQMVYSDDPSIRCRLEGQLRYWFSVTRKLCFCLSGSAAGMIDADNEPVLWCCQLTEGAPQFRFHYVRSPGSYLLNQVEAICEVLSWDYQVAKRATRFNCHDALSSLSTIAWYLEVEFRHSLGETFCCLGWDPQQMRKRGAQADGVFVSARKLCQSLFCLSMANDRKRESLNDSLVIGQIKDGVRRAGLMAELHSRRVFPDVHQLLSKPGIQPWGAGEPIPPQQVCIRGMFVFRLVSRPYS